jgi:hypothetical protein
MLLRFETARKGDIEHPRIWHAQQIHGTFYPMAQHKLVWTLTRRSPKHLREMGSTQSCRFGQFIETQITLDFRVHQLCNNPQARWRESTSMS